jgi:hypothetical protein
MVFEMQEFEHQRTIGTVDEPDRAGRNSTFNEHPLQGMYERPVGVQCLTAAAPSRHCLFKGARYIHRRLTCFVNDNDHAYNTRCLAGSPLAIGLSKIYPRGQEIATVDVVSDV